mmetsp:Transcript_3330/g.5640  ORF Transcript_3330/g.5640 Transcript_3330/m.5640 type:complete len:438 (+) Transcript_3330:68-1381(+)
MKSVESLKDDEWIIRGKVYGLSAFRKTHPGGTFILDANRRRDCTELFESYHLLSSRHDYISTTLQKYYLRDETQQESQSPYDWNDPLYHEMKIDLRDSVKAHFVEKQIKSYKASNAYLSMYFAFIVSAMVNLYFYLNGSYVAAIIFGGLLWVLSSEAMHNGTHYAVFKKPTWNLLYAKVCGFYHCLSSFWFYQHVISHHSYTNIEGKDIDLEWHHGLYLEFEKDGDAYHQYWGILPALLSVLTSLTPIMACLKHEVVLSPRGQEVVKFIGVEWRSKSYYDVVLQSAALFIVMPLVLVYKLGVLKAVLFYAIPRLIHGSIYYLFSQVSHINQPSFRNQEFKHSKNFLVHQIMGALDYATTSRLWGFLSIGLNNQAMHHVLPNVHPCHYPRLADVFAAFCKKYKIQRVVHETLWDAVKAHYSHLFRMNSKAYIESSKAN